MTADRERVDTETEKWPTDTVCQAEISQPMEGYDCTRLGWKEGETLGNRSDLCKGIRRSAAMNSLWCQFICF